MSESIVYKIENKLNGKIYIGSTKNKEKRWRDHKSALRSNRHINPHLQNAWNKYSSDNFEFSVLEKVDSEDNLLDCEQSYLDKRNPEYNIAVDAKAPTKGRERSEKTKRKLSRAQKGKRHSEECKRKISKALNGENNPMYGRQRSKEVREKMSRNHANFTGENHPTSKLTKKKVKVIKYLLEGGQFTYEQIGKMFGVTRQAIFSISMGRNWGHVKITS